MASLSLPMDDNGDDNGDFDDGWVLSPRTRTAYIRFQTFNLKHWSSHQILHNHIQNINICLRHVRHYEAEREDYCTKCFAEPNHFLIRYRGHSPDWTPDPATWLCRRCAAVIILQPMFFEIDILEFYK